jgi:hypothetical protein
MVQQMLVALTTLTLDKTSLLVLLLEQAVTLKFTDVNGNSATETEANCTVEDKMRGNCAVQKHYCSAMPAVVSIVAECNVGSAVLVALTLGKTSFCANVGANTVTLEITDVNGNIAAETAV